MQQVTEAYNQTAKTTANPRNLEATLLTKSALQLKELRDNWEERQSELEEYLTYNRKLWTVFTTSVADDENPLPQPIKNNIASLGVFILNHSVTVQANPAPEKLNTLIAINQEIAAGLRG